MQGKLKSTQKLEIWKPIRGLENYYAVSNLGAVKSLERKTSLGTKKLETILTQRIVRNYQYVMLDVCDGEFRFRRNISVHRLVAQEFCNNAAQFREVNHKDGNRLNNHADNLEWVSPEENKRHAKLLGLYKKNSVGNRKHTYDKIQKVFEMRKSGMLHKDIGIELGMGASTVTHILRGTRRALRKDDELSTPSTC
jgi:NUMOD4 motif/HNH endonuclease